MCTCVDVYVRAYTNIQNLTSFVTIQRSISSFNSSDYVRANWSQYVSRSNRVTCIRRKIYQMDRIGCTSHWRNVGSECTSAINDSSGEWFNNYTAGAFRLTNTFIRTSLCILIHCSDDKTETNDSFMKNISNDVIILSRKNDSYIVRHIRLMNYVWISNNALNAFQ